MKAFTGANIFDGTGKMSPGTLVVDKERVVSVITDGTPPPAEAEVVDVSGKTIMPGLFDCHVHINASCDPDWMTELRKLIPQLSVEGAVNAFRTLKAGFTTLRDAGARGLADMAVKMAIEEGLIVGPRLQVAGSGFSITGGHGDIEAGWPPEFQMKGYTVVDGVDEARREARRQIRYGVDNLKLAATGGVLSVGDLPQARGLTLEEMTVIIDEGLNVGKKSMAHAQGTGGIKNAILAGIHSIEHGCFLDDEVVGMMVERDVYFVPTLVAPHYIVKHGTEAGIPEYAVEKAKVAHDAHMESVRKAYAAGVKIAMGTDAGTPFNFHGKNAFEFVLMVEAGMSVVDVLLSGTKTAAELMGWQDKVGTLAPGKLADFIVVDGNPVEDISVLAEQSNIEQVFKGGQLVTDMFVK